MRWVTRRNAHIDRTGCPWLILRFIDPAAEFVFVPADTDPATVDGIPFDMRGVALGHQAGRCTFETFLEQYHLTDDAALVEMGRILREADVPHSRTRRREAAGIDAVITGFQMTTPDDQEKLARTAPLYEALYAYCRRKVEQAPSDSRPRPTLRYRQRVDAHLADEMAHDLPPANPSPTSQN
ncbi:MAG TPA: chromate resistance protein ChrB domain-containing protein [Chloroflexota bacterium]|jgi:hypothetical protein